MQKFGSADYKALTPEMRKTFVKIISQDLTDELPRIKAPTLLYWGAEDTETPLWMGKMMEEKIPDAGLVVQEGAGAFRLSGAQSGIPAHCEKFPAGG